jgi:Tfp pilus assembly protein PilN
MNAPNQLSFLPEDYLIRKAQHRTNLICASLFVVMIGAITVAFTTAERGLAAAESRHAAVDQQYVDAAKRIAEMKQLQERQQVLARQADLAASLIDRVPRSYLLAEITNKLPGGVSLRDMEMTRKKRTAAAPTKTTALAKRKSARPSKNGPKALELPPPPDLYDVTIKLTGVASNDAQVARFVTNLSESEMFSEVNLLLSAQLERSEDDLRKFNLEMVISSTADIRPVANARSNQLTKVEQ